MTWCDGTQAMMRGRQRPFFISASCGSDGGRNCYCQQQAQTDGPAPMPIGERTVASNTPPPGRRQDRDRLLLRAHAHRFAEAMAPYRADHPLALREAHRLLDTRMRREAILSCIHDIERRAGKAPRRGIYGRFAMPSIREDSVRKPRDA